MIEALTIIFVMMFMPLACLYALTKLITRAKQSPSRYGPPKPLTPQNQYRAKNSLLTPTELRLYHTLRSALPDLTICPTVRIADIVKPTTNNYSDLNRITSKHADFVLCDNVTLRPIAIIELDDASHQRPDRQQRDAFIDTVYTSAGIPIIHVTPQPVYDEEDLAAYIRQYCRTYQSSLK